MVKVPADEITTQDAARILGVAPATIVAYADKGILPTRRLPSGHRRFRRSDVEALLQGPPPERRAS